MPEGPPNAETPKQRVLLGRTFQSAVPRASLSSRKGSGKEKGGYSALRLSSGPFPFSSGLKPTTEAVSGIIKCFCQLFVRESHG